MLKKNQAAPHRFHRANLDFSSRYRRVHPRR